METWKTGDENFHHYAVELATGEIRDLTPYDNVHSKIIPSSISGLYPYDICICMNICNKTDFDVVRNFPLYTFRNLQTKYPLTWSKSSVFWRTTASGKKVKLSCVKGHILVKNCVSRWYNVSNELSFTNEPPEKADCLAIFTLHLKNDPLVYGFVQYKVNIRTGEAVLDTQNPGDVSDWLCDSLFQIRGALHYDLSDGSSTICVRDAIDAPWREVCQWSSEDQGSMVIC